MTGRVRALWRHPIKGHGREPLDQVQLTEGRAMPWDRRWAVAHDRARLKEGDWNQTINFSQGTKISQLMAIDAKCDEASETVTLRHPERPDLTFRPDQDAQAFLDWVRPLMPPERAQSTRIVKLVGRGNTDTDYPSVSLINLASNADLANKVGVEVSALRWRCNIHFDGFAPWEEFDWIGKTLRIGSVDLLVREPIRRCMATTVNPRTGERDLDTLGALNKNWNHQNFGLYAEVKKSGDIAIDDPVVVL